MKLNRNRDVLSEINVTPFVDVMLVLLIITWFFVFSAICRAIPLQSAGLRNSCQGDSLAVVPGL